MTRRKTRLTVTVDAELVALAESEVARGRAASVSGWVNVALADRAEKERKLRALADAIHAYEAKHGRITDAEVAKQLRDDREKAFVVRGPSRRGRKVRGRAA